MATDFNTNATSSTGGFKPASVDTPLDIRTRVETEADILTIPKPYIGMIVYVRDTGKRYEILSLKDGKVGILTVKNGLVDQYRELPYAIKETVDSQIADLQGQIDLKANAGDVPSLDGYATEEYVVNKIAEAQLDGGDVDLSGYATKSELEGKVDKEEGKGLSSFDFTAELKAKLDTLPTTDQIAAMLDAKVDKEEGKSLTSFDFTADLKAKLDDLPTRAEIEEMILANAGGDCQFTDDMKNAIENELINRVSYDESNIMFHSRNNSIISQIELMNSDDVATIILGL